jgi:fumarate reductase flavoprotein subunit
LTYSTSRLKNLLFFSVISAVFLLTAACSGGKSGTSAGSVVYTPGTYQGSGEGYEGTITVAVTVDEKKILRIEVLEHTETPGYSTAAFDGLIETIIDANSAEVDALSGASETSEGFLAATAEALEKARP